MILTVKRDDSYFENISTASFSTKYYFCLNYVRLPQRFISQCWSRKKFSLVFGSRKFFSVELYTAEPIEGLKSRLLWRKAEETEESWKFLSIIYGKGHEHWKSFACLLEQKRSCQRSFWSRVVGLSMFVQKVVTAKLSNSYHQRQRNRYIWLIFSTLNWWGKGDL